MSVKSSSGDFQTIGVSAPNQQGLYVMSETEAPEGAVSGRTSLALLDRDEVLKTKRGYWFVRRMQDILLSAIALVVLAVPMLIVALAIVIDDPKGGPVFKQIRVGRDGKLFTFYKFRSMCVDAESKLEELLSKNEMDGPAFKIKEDPRVTRVGRFIRKYSIDELPQLWNVLKGDMSIVGPRPALPREVEQYGAYERQRLLVQPGLTCYWQIQPNRNKLNFQKWLDLDIQYIKDRSFITDWKIIFKTFIVIFHAQGV